MSGISIQLAITTSHHLDGWQHLEIVLQSLWAPQPRGVGGAQLGPAASAGLSRGQDSEHGGGIVQASVHDGVDSLIQAHPGGYELGLLGLARNAPVLGQQAQVLGEEDPGSFCGESG